MEVRIAVFEPINRRVRNDSEEPVQTSKYFEVFANQITERCIGYNACLNNPPNREQIQLLIDPACIVAWSAGDSKRIKDLFISLCKGIMSDAFLNHIAVRGYVDQHLVDGKSWVSPEFYHERYWLKWSPEVTKALDQLKSMPWCGVCYSKEAAADTNRDFFISDNNGIVSGQNNSLLEYNFERLNRTIIALHWLQYHAPLEYILQDLFRLNYDPDPECEVQHIITNTIDFIKYAQALKPPRPIQPSPTTLAFEALRRRLRT